MEKEFEIPFQECKKSPLNHKVKEDENLKPQSEKEQYRVEETKEIKSDKELPSFQKDENDKTLLEILKQIGDTNQKIENLNELFLKKIHNIDFEKVTADRLHRELQQYKNDLYFQLIKPIIMDLINMRESMKKRIESFSEGEEIEEEKLKFLESYVQEIQIILENNDVEIYKTDIEIEKKVDVKKQKIMKKIETQDEESHGKIYKVTSDGYMYKEKVISPEKVEVYIYKQ